jgi:hypothetical protein
MDGPSFGKAFGDAVVGMMVIAFVVGLLVAGGCAFVLTSDYLPSIRFEWKSPSPPSSEKVGE